MLPCPLKRFEINFYGERESLESKSLDERFRLCEEWGTEIKRRPRRKKENKEKQRKRNA